MNKVLDLVSQRTFIRILTVAAILILMDVAPATTLCIKLLASGLRELLEIRSTYTRMEILLLLLAERELRNYVPVCSYGGRLRIMPRGIHDIPGAATLFIC